METQNYANHKRYVPMFHFVLFGVIIVTVIGSFINLFESFGDHERLYNASLIAVISLCMLRMFFFLRNFVTRVQDRAIRAEENLRHFAMTGKLFDPKLTMPQILALRFASDEEYLDLLKRAIAENLSNKQIKQAVKNWRADHHRV